MQPSQWNLAELHGPLLSDLLHQTGHIVVSVKNEQALHLYQMHHVMAHLPPVTCKTGSREQSRMKKGLMPRRLI
jgi:hypothetical protein